MSPSKGKDILVFFQYHLQEMIFSTFIIITMRNGALLIISLTDSEAAVRAVLHVAPSFGHKCDSLMPPVFLAGKLVSKTLVTTCVCEANSLNQRQVEVKAIESIM